MPGPEHKTVQLVPSRCLTYAQGRSLSRASSSPRCRLWRCESHATSLRVAPLLWLFTFAVLGGGKRKEKQRLRPLPRHRCVGAVVLSPGSCEQTPSRGQTQPPPAHASGPAPGTTSSLQPSSPLVHHEGHHEALQKAPRWDNLTVDLRTLPVSQPSPRAGKQPAPRQARACCGAGSLGCRVLSEV